MRRRKNQLREALDAKREALTRAANQPKPEQAWEPETPELRAEVLADRLQERDAEPAKVQEHRRAAERKVQELSNPRRTLGTYLASLVNQYQGPAAVTEEAGAA